MKPTEAVAAAYGAAADALFVSSLGTATSALRRVSDDGPHLYLGGAMGCGLPVAMGVADARPDREVVAVLGDGDLIMGAGALWSLSGLGPRNLVVLILDDGRYSITGGQEVVAPGATAAVAAALPGVTCAPADTAAEVAATVAGLPRPSVVLARIDEPEWPGPSPFVDPPDVLRRFAARVAGA